MERLGLRALCVLFWVILGCSNDDGGAPGGSLVRGEGPRNACSVSVECAGGKLCDFDVLRCVECTSDSSCGADKPACDYREGKCHECTDDRHCRDDQPICDTVKESCEPRCARDGDCHNKELPRCDVATGRCFACELDADCKDRKKPFCDDHGVCVECTEDGQCGGKGKLCVPPQGKCVECRSASDCGADKPFCLDFHCTECLRNADCPASEPLCGGDGKCKKCDCDPVFGDCSTGECVCSAGLTACGGRCIDLTSDPSHCGACDRKCEDDSVCSGARCVCRPGLIECGGKCVDPDTDPAHCGQCGRACDTRCAAGECVTDSCELQQAVACGKDQAACVPRSSLEDHPLHCGGCDQRCHENEVCVGGACREYAPGRACNQCPCDDCAGGTCCPQPLSSGLVFCVAGDSCPKAF